MITLDFVYVLMGLMLAGIAIDRDSATNEAAVIWTIMNPLESPGSSVRNAPSAG